MEFSRKRHRSDDNNYELQHKYFINERLVEKNDKILMEKIYQKTLNMMFAGMKSNSRQLERSKHEQSIEIDDNEKSLDTVEDILPNTTLGCKLCLNDVEKSTNNICSNCNLLVCQRCILKCCYCSVKLLCVNCVNIFGCTSLENGNEFSTPLCEDCKNYLH